MTTETVIDTAALDAELAEELFPPKTHPEYWWFRDTNMWDGYPDLPAPAGQLPLYAGPALSTTGDGMLMVLEALAERGLWITVAVNPDGVHESSIDKYRPEYGEVGHHGYADHDSLPTAVALAALSALNS